MVTATNSNSPFELNSHMVQKTPRWREGYSQSTLFSYDRQDKPVQAAILVSLNREDGRRG